MSLKRYVYIYAVEPQALLERYLATDNPANHPDLSNAPGISASERERRRLVAQAWTELTARAAANDLMASNKWAVADADLLMAHPTDSAVPQRMRDFLLQPPAHSSQFIHFADRELALAYLQSARALSLQYIAGLPTALAQARAVIEKWGYFAGYWRALNLRPWSYGRLRSRWETQIGQWRSTTTSCPRIGQSINGNNESLVHPPGNMPVGLFMRRPTPLDVSNYATGTLLTGPSENRDNIYQDSSGRYIQGNVGTWPGDGAGAWRNNAIQMFQSTYGGDFNLGALRVRFGTRTDISVSGREPENACALVGSEVGPTSCVGPTGDVHRIWLCNSATLGGGINITSEDDIDRSNCVRRSITDGTTTGPDLISGPAGPNWLCAYLSPPYSTTELRARESGISANSHASKYFEAYLPTVAPFLWYAQLIEPLIETLSRQDPLATVMECQYDLLGHNGWTTVSCGGGNPTELATMGLTVGAATIASAQGSIGKLTQIIGTVAGLAGMVNPLAGALIGLAAGIVNALGNSVFHSDANSPLDVFGRIEPCFDTLSIVERSRSVDATYVADIMPPPHALDTSGPGIPAAVATGVILSTVESRPAPAVGTTVGRNPYLMMEANSTNIDRLSGPRVALIPDTTGTLYVQNMPWYGNVYIDGVQVDGNEGRWTDPSQVTWAVPIPSGMHEVRIEPPNGGDSRFDRVTIAPNGEITLPFNSLPTAAQRVVIDQHRQPAENPTGVSTGAKMLLGGAVLAAVVGGVVLSRKKS